ncbi:hypothetical protein [Nocardioides sp.]|uniref:hypothetical protein n=1 Tax=Nocardioides sp. TaxID=35761 RepID=UPI0026108675|nr:hypothetical protein [Nocardioides sp.]
MVRRLLVLPVMAVVAALWCVLPVPLAVAGGGNDLTDGQAMYVVSTTGTTYVATDVIHGGFAAIGTAALQPHEFIAAAAYDAPAGTAYVVVTATTASASSSTLASLDLSTGELTRIARFANQEVFGPNPYPLVQGIAVTPGGLMYAVAQGDDLTSPAMTLYAVTHTADTATLSAKGSTGVPYLRAITADPRSGLLVGLREESTHGVVVISPANGALLGSALSVGSLPSGTYALAVDRDASDQKVWALTYGTSSGSALWGGSLGSTSVAFSANTGAGGTITDAGGAPIPAYGLMIAPKRVEFGAGITGTARVGAVLTATTGDLASGVSVTYQWRRDGTPIGGATAATYRPTTTDVGRAITVREVATQADRLRTTSTSAAVTVAAASTGGTGSGSGHGTDAACGGTRPVIAGTPRRGQRLRVASCTVPTTLVWHGHRYRGVVLDPSRRRQRVTLGSTTVTVRLTTAWLARHRVVGTRPTLRLTGRLVRRIDGARLQVRVTVRVPGARAVRLPLSAATTRVR